MRSSVFFKLSWGALLLVLLAFATAQPLNVQADMRQSTPTTEGTEAVTPAATATVECPQIPLATATPDATNAVDAKPTVSEAGYLGIAAENSIDGCGVKVVDLDPDGPATKAGVKLNDVIYGAASLETRSVDKLKALIKSLPANSEVALYIIRNKQPIIVRVTLASFAASHAAVTPTLPVTATPDATATIEATQTATSEPTSQATTEATTEPTQQSTDDATPTSEGTPTS
jgi:predicted metalloprotease with PDZ domain